MATVYREPASTRTTEVGFFRRISWGAIFAGTIVALVIGLALSLLGMGIGLGTINPATEQNPLGGIGIGAGIWMAISTLISLFAGGWVASRMAGYPRSLLGVLHGVVVWGLVTLFSFYLMTTAIGMLLSGVAGVLGRGISLLGSGVAAVAQQATRGEGDPVQTIINQAQQLFSQRGATLDPEMRESLQSILTGQDVTPADRERVISMLAQRTQMNRSEAEQAVNTWIQQRQQAEQFLQQVPGTAAQVTEQAMSALSTAAIWAFIAVVLGAIAAAAGGAVGTPKDVLMPTEEARR
ncbi:MAG: hypothetical protein AB1805_07305 [Nitrospirota bacterium]